MKKFCAALSLLFAVCLPAFRISAQSLDTVEVTCIHVDQLTGHTTLEWSLPDDPANEFQNYAIYLSSNGGSFFQVTDAPTNYGQLSYTNSLAAGLVNQICMYVQAQGITANGDVYFTPPSDTICTIDVDLGYYQATSGIAELSWTNPYVYDTLPPSGLNYQLLVEYPSGTWTPVGTFDLDSLYAIYESPYCQADLNFQVLLTQPGGCAINSNIQGAQFTDNVAPAIPEVTSVSVNDAGAVEITWNPSTSPDTQAYIIYSFINNVQVALDTVFGWNNTSYVATQPGLNTAFGPVSFLVAAYDQCPSPTSPSGNLSATQSTPSTSIYLDPIPYGVCADQIHISWSPYIGWSEGVESYVIYRSIDGAAFEVVATVPGDQLDYFDPQLNYYSSQSYYIEAVSNIDQYRARSGNKAVIVVYPDKPHYTYIETATVSSESEVTVNVLTTATNFEIHYILQKEKRFEPGTWDDVYELVSSTQTNLVFIDPDVNTSVFSYRYRVILKNQCNDFIDTTNIGKTILLQGVSDKTLFQNILQWTLYEDWPNDVTHYELIRRQGENGADEVVFNGPATSFFKDDISELYNEPGQFCYVINAYSDGFPEVPGEVKSTSNELCLTVEPGIWIPNCFVIDSKHPERRQFGPVFSFADVQEFRMIIYSRWGDVIYDSTDYSRRWDGSGRTGSTCQEGEYVYYVSVKDGRGKSYERRGKVLLLVGPEPNN